ncbi:MAG: ABC transporter permease [Sedimentisphaerales bacterium]|nr:ABC transporter permease [Sedimentisphaerales bacterium]
MTTLWQDLRYAVRMLRKTPGFTAIALVTLAIGIGSNTIMFSLSDLLLFLQPRKVKSPEQVAFCGIQNTQFPWFRYPAYLALRDSRVAFSDLMAQGVIEESATLVHGESARHVRTTFVSANYFSFLGATPVRGRAFLPEDEQSGSAPVAVLSHRCWKRLGSDPRLVGAFATLNGARCQVVGVAPEDFTGATLLGPDLWLSLGSYRTVSMFARRAKRPESMAYPPLHVVGRLNTDVTMPVAQAQLQALVPRFKLQYPEDWEGRSSFDLHPPGRTEITGDHEMTRLVVTVFSLVLMAASAIILMIACLNLANMLIVQGASRHREIAVRLALGGGRLRIVRQLFIESGLLALLGGVCGVLLAFCGTRILNLWIAAIPDSGGPLGDLQTGLNLHVLGATLGVCLIATLLFGLRPALWLSKRDIASEMKGAAGRVLGSFGRRRDGLSVAGQIALAVALVLSASLLTRSALQLAQPDPRFPLEDKLVVHVDPLSTGDDKVQSLQVYKDLTDRLASLPGVQALGTAPRLFFGGGGPVIVREYLPGEQASGSRKGLLRRNAMINVGRDYFTAMEIPLLQGRLFDPLDSVPEAEKVAIIDEPLARKLRPDGDALGCLIQWSIPEAGGMVPDVFRVVGIVAHMPGIGDREVRGQMYTPTESDGLSSYLYLRVADKKSVDALRQQVAEEIQRVAPRMPVLSVATLAQRRDDESSVWLARFGARLGLAAGAAALFLATLGIYAIKGYMVASRTSEIGLRKALGATHGSVMGMVLREGLVLTIVGLTVGLLLGLGVAKVSASMLYGISPVDPISIIVTVTLLGVASLLASYIPARRAAKVDPMVALRYE